MILTSLDSLVHGDAAVDLFVQVKACVVLCKALLMRRLRPLYTAAVLGHADTALLALLCYASHTC